MNLGIISKVKPQDCDEVAPIYHVSQNFSFIYFTAIKKKIRCSFWNNVIFGRIKLNHPSRRWH